MFLLDMQGLSLGRRRGYIYAHQDHSYMKRQLCPSFFSDASTDTVTRPRIRVRYHLELASILAGANGTLHVDETGGGTPRIRPHHTGTTSSSR